MNQRTIIVDRAVWDATWHGLKQRGGGCRESACVWAGRRSVGHESVEAVHFLDDLPGVRRHALSHRTSRAATSILFERLRDAGHVIIADVHTHPEEWVGLSPTDAAHPIEYRKGLIALVLPYFATGHPDVKTLGVHEYLGEGDWHQLSEDEAVKLLHIQ